MKHGKMQQSITLHGIIIITEQVLIIYSTLIYKTTSIKNTSKYLWR